MVDSRPNPDQLLRQATLAEQARQRGKLKIFFGAAPGVGKTCAMLESAQALRRSGVDVVVGVIETHGRAGTAALLDGLELLPRALEFDLDAALRRKPELILVDELAHTNARGSRHLKRWQDVAELLDAGIEVWSTLNVQHIESLNDVVAQITGVVVRETVPDSVLDLASEIELVDLPVEELIARMKAGKIYIPEQAERALSHFFRPGNLNALREMALRRTAEKVDSSVLAERSASPAGPTWPVSERLLLAIGPSPYAANLVRAAKRLALLWDASWMVIHVETTPLDALPESSRKALLDAMALADSLGATTATIGGQSVASTIIDFARLHNATRILVGKSPGSRLVGALIEASAEISVIALDGGGRLQRRLSFEFVRPRLRELGESLLILSLATALALPLRGYIASTNIVMLYLLAVLAIAFRSSRTTAVLSSLAAVASFDFFCVPPYLTFAVSDFEYILTFIVMLVASLIVSSLTVRLRQEAHAAIVRESAANALFRFSSEIAEAHRLFDVALALAALVERSFTTQANVFLPESDNRISFRRRARSAFQPPSQEVGIAQWAFDHAQSAGKLTATLPGATVQYHPLRSRDHVFAVLAIAEPPASPNARALFQALLDLAAQAMDRIQNRDLARQSALDAESERLRNSLLSSVSHDIRTPLTSIATAAETLRTSAAATLSPEAAPLLTLIESESHRLNRLVTNLLELTRLEHRRIDLRREPCALDDILASVLDQLEPQLASHPLDLQVTPQLPLVSGEPLLLSQAMRNLVENAIDHTPAATPLCIRLSASDGAVQFSIADTGPGLAGTVPADLFRKFERGAASSSRGIGLGLVIVKAIVEAHGGAVEAHSNQPSGAVFTFQIPADTHAKPSPDPAG